MLRGRSEKDPSLSKGHIHIHTQTYTHTHSQTHGTHTFIHTHTHIHTLMAYTHTHGTHSQIYTHKHTHSAHIHTRSWHTLSQTHTHTHSWHTHTFTHTLMAHKHMHSHIFILVAHTHIHIYIPTHTHTLMAHSQTRTHTYAHSHTHTHTHTLIAHTHTFSHTHSHTLATYAQSHTHSTESLGSSREPERATGRQRDQEKVKRWRVRKRVEGRRGGKARNFRELWPRPRPVLVKVVQSCPTLCDPMDRSPWNYSGQRVAIPPPGDLPNPGMEPRSPALQMDSLPTKPTGKPKASLEKGQTEEHGARALPGGRICSVISTSLPTAPTSHPRPHFLHLDIGTTGLDISEFTFSS